jgi:hypothetical protein
MRRRLASLLAAVLAASTLGVLSSAQPAPAADVCFGAGGATIGGNGLFYPLVGTRTTTWGTGGGSVTFYPLPQLLPFIMSLSVAGLCVSGAPPPEAGGLVSGWCGHSWGSGATSAGDRFALIGAGSFLLLTGGLTGLLNMTPNVPGGHNCTTGASEFLVSGGAVITDCNLFKQKLDELPLPGPIPDPVPHELTTVTTIQDTGINLRIAGGDYHVWHKLCLGT